MYMVNSVCRHGCGILCKALNCKPAGALLMARQPVIIVVAPLKIQILRQPYGTPQVTRYGFNFK
eukprot:4160967-Amphidinium_carterae.1